MFIRKVDGIKRKRILEISFFYLTCATNQILNMKKILTFLWVLTMIQAASAQSFSPTAIVSAGNAVTTSDGTYISWSIGETFVTTLSGGDVILTPGFQQPGEEVDADGDGWLASEDCNDLNPMVFPGAAEFCNLMDDDCDGAIDDGVSNAYYFD